MKCCPWCNKQLSVNSTSIVSTTVSYSCDSKDHQYTDYYNNEDGNWQELIFNNTAYYGNDIYKICKLRAFT